MHNDNIAERRCVFSYTPKNKSPHRNVHVVAHEVDKLYSLTLRNTTLSNVHTIHFKKINNLLGHVKRVELSKFAFTSRIIIF